MALLPQNDIDDVWKIGMEKNTEDYLLAKDGLKAFYAAVDQWVQDNKLSFNASLPEPAKTALSTQQKSEGLVDIIERRFKRSI